MLDNECLVINCNHWIVKVRRKWKKKTWTMTSMRCDYLPGNFSQGFSLHEPWHRMGEIVCKVIPYWVTRYMNSEIAWMNILRVFCVDFLLIRTMTSNVLDYLQGYANYPTFCYIRQWKLKGEYHYEKNQGSRKDLVMIKLH